MKPLNFTSDWALTPATPTSRFAARGLPHGTGKTKRVLVLPRSKADEALEAGADLSARKMVAKIQSENWFDYDVVVATPDMMGVVGRLGRVLDPRV